MPFEIVTDRETYLVDDSGNIGRYDRRTGAVSVVPSDSWRVLALVRRCNFGVLETIPFGQWATRLEAIQWTFKNGKPRYTLRDLDHGTIREWGESVRRVYVKRECVSA